MCGGGRDENRNFGIIVIHIVDDSDNDNLFWHLGFDLDTDQVPVLVFNSTIVLCLIQFSTIGLSSLELFPRFFISYRYHCLDHGPLWSYILNYYRSLQEYRTVKKRCVSVGVYYLHPSTKFIDIFIVKNSWKLKKNREIDGKSWFF